MLQTETSRVDTFEHRVNVATTVHEAIHQLMFHTGLQTARVQYPLWISEGLATAFETDRTDVAFGPRHESTPRREVFERLLRDNRLLVLATLVTLTEIPTPDPALHRSAADDLVQTIYHQSYALVTWLCQRRPSGMRRYIDLMRDIRGQMVSPILSMARDIVLDWNRLASMLI